MPKKPANSTAKKRKAKQSPERKTPDGVRELGDQLREIAKKFDLYAKMMERLKVPDYKIQIGNFNNSKQTIFEFLTIQLKNRLSTTASKQGLEIHDILTEENESNNNLKE